VTGVRGLGGEGASSARSGTALRAVIRLCRLDGSRSSIRAAIPEAITPHARHEGRRQGRKHLGRGIRKRKAVHDCQGRFPAETV